MKNKNNKIASGLILAMGLVLIMSLLVLYILDYMIPYSKNVKGIENSTNAFYQAESSIENGLKFIKDRQIDIDNGVEGPAYIRTETGATFESNTIAKAFTTTSSGFVIPPSGEGNSSYNSDFNVIGPGQSIQLEVGDGLNFDWGTDTMFNLNVPDIDKLNSETLSGSTTAIINWQLSTNSNTLNATGSWITADDINNGVGIYLGNKGGIDLNGNELDFGDFYSNNCGNGSGCILKMFLIRELVTTTGVKLPFLEYKIQFNEKAPLRYSRIKSIGKSYGFQKKLEIKVPQQTTNEAFGFTIIQ